MLAPRSGMTNGLATLARRETAADRSEILREREPPFQGNVLAENDQAPFRVRGGDLAPRTDQKAAVEIVEFPVVRARAGRGVIGSQNHPDVMAHHEIRDCPVGFPFVPQHVGKSRFRPDEQLRVGGLVERALREFNELRETNSVLVGIPNERLGDARLHENCLKRAGGRAPLSKLAGTPRENPDQDDERQEEITQPRFEASVRTPLPRLALGYGPGIARTRRSSKHEGARRAPRKTRPPGTKRHTRPVTDAIWMSGRIRTATRPAGSMETR